MARERVTFLVHSFARVPGGGARTYYEHANRLARRGYRVSVVHSQLRREAPSDRLRDIARDKVRDLRAGTLRRRVAWMEIDPSIDMLFVDRFDDRTELPPADLRIGTYWRTTQFLGARAADRVPFMQLIQAYETWAGPADEVDAVWRLPVQAAVVSRALRQRGLELGVPAERLHLVPNGVDHAVFSVSTAIPGRPPVLAFLAHEAPVKGLDAAIGVARLVHERRPDARIVAFGARPRPAVMPPFVRYLRRPVGRELADRVYNRCSVFLCSSLTEGFGFPSVEAMSCGAALVSTRNGGVDDFAVDGESALLADVGDLAGLADAVCALFGDEQRRVDIATKGRESASRYSWDAAADAFESVVRRALGTA